MKKALCILSAVIMLMTLGTACGKKTENNAEAPKTTAYNPADWTEVITKDDETIVKLKISDNEYELNYMDENGNAVKTEHYKNDRCTFYYIFAPADKNGNTRQEYYSGDGKLFAVYDAIGLSDAKGKPITETEMQKLIDSYNK